LSVLFRSDYGIRVYEMQPKLTVWFFFNLFKYIFFSYEKIHGTISEKYQRFASVKYFIIFK
jgi:hypothetical protein